MKRICVFCGSSGGGDPVYVDAATALGKLLAERGIGLVYGGASVGLMGAVADGAVAAGGEVIGVIPEHLKRVEIAHAGLSELVVTADMHERKAKMAEYADAFLALPGGAGTLEELAEVWTWAQLGLHGKPIGLVDVRGYYRPFRDFIDHMVTEKFLRAEHRDLVFVDEDPAALLDAFARYEAPDIAKWQ
ncbi:TIGR00730 family Rossman fold protein [Amycolatopsis thermalba]|uniref:LOG family protein n=1 Tax=Amycolatopsis thermalba TaxID=944492 RepID=UPI000E269BF7|nr:TIGR00730 family Rossman fold protein [Amycolatopsis thermalba]